MCAHVYVRTGDCVETNLRMHTCDVSLIAQVSSRSDIQHSQWVHCDFKACLKAVLV